ncbi:S-adenosylmethionine:tRNA ribosyltransferase-isomerase [Candidatus Peregrinibacteria bacterium]|nr:S-adenosylmethionine:tRNA ribosyltransferase-isomerase [Candidatus Peregrinibacteria bacterium]
MRKSRIIALRGMVKIRTSQFDYSLPKKFIAESPFTPRDSSKLMGFDTHSDNVFHEKFSDVKSFLKKGDVLVVNKSKVIPARIIFEKDGKRCEIFILKKIADNLYEVLVKPGKYFHNGSEFKVGKSISCKVENVFEDGTRMISFKSDVLEDIDYMLEKNRTNALAALY